MESMSFSFKKERSEVQDPCGQWVVEEVPVFLEAAEVFKPLHEATSFSFGLFCDDGKLLNVVPIIIP